MDSRIPTTWEEHRFLVTVKRLDQIVKDKEIVQSIPTGGNCPYCGCPIHGHLDESKLKWVPGTLEKEFNTPAVNRVVLPDGNGPGQARTVLAAQYVPPMADVAPTPAYNSVYALKQLIVKSGLYTRKQLAPSNFTEHELEVNDYSFLQVRPKSDCECTLSYDSDEVEIEDVYNWSVPGSYDVGVTNITMGKRVDDKPLLPEVATPTEVEAIVEKDHEDEWARYRAHREAAFEAADAAFAFAGRTFRRGARRRSPEARQRRAERKRSLRIRKCCPLPSNCALGTGLYSVNPNITLELKFKYLPPRSKQKKGSKPRFYNARLVEERSRSDRLTVPDRRMVKKDWYFLRKDRSFYHSVHSHK
jgi:hypothetical protein